VEQARLLLDHGADLFARLESEAGLDTPIRVKARFPRDGALRYMLERGNIAIDPYLACVLGDTADVMAAVHADPSLVHAATGASHVLGGGILLLHLAVQYGHAALVTFLLDQGADVNARARSAAGYGESGMPGTTPLHVAAAAGQAEIARLLIERGADVHATAGDQQLTPLAIAEAVHADWIDRAEVAALLREKAHSH
jgi:ankyrin repeat protein